MDFWFSIKCRKSEKGLADNVHSSISSFCSFARLLNCIFCSNAPFSQFQSCELLSLLIWKSARFSAIYDAPFFIPIHVLELVLWRKFCSLREISYLYLGSYISKFTNEFSLVTNRIFCDWWYMFSTHNSAGLHWRGDSVDPGPDGPRLEDLWLSFLGKVVWISLADHFCQLLSMQS